jgi:hypothetical protein
MYSDRQVHAIVRHTGFLPGGDSIYQPVCIYRQPLAAIQATIEENAKLGLPVPDLTPDPISRYRAYTEHLAENREHLVADNRLMYYESMAMCVRFCDRQVPAVTSCQQNVVYLVLRHGPIAGSGFCGREIATSLRSVYAHPDDAKRYATERNLAKGHCFEVGGVVYIDPTNAEWAATQMEDVFGDPQFPEYFDACQRDYMTTVVHRDPKLKGYYTVQPATVI